MKKTLAILVLAAAAFSLPASASAIYNINFGLSQGTPLPTGSFDYDSGSGFTNFTVNWDGQSFDFTPVANGMTLTADPPTGCGPTTSGVQPAYAFQLMTQTAAGCNAVYAWMGVYSPMGGYATFAFILNPGGNSQSQDVLLQQDLVTPQLAYNNVATGSWTAAAESSTPEPGTLGMMLLGALAVGSVRPRRRR